MVAIEDLFLVGLGLDASGAYLLARGLLASEADVERRAGSHYDWSTPEAVAQARDKVDGRFGLTALVLGFSIQAVGYGLSLGGLGGSTGAAQATVGIIGCFLAGLAVLTTWRLARDSLVRRVLVGVASYRHGVRQVHPSARKLLSFGQELGDAPREDEILPGGAVRYARRVFGVEADPSVDLLG